MDANRKKELLESYQNRCPEMGVISLFCKETGESFLGISMDTKAGLNSARVKLSSGNHPNKRLLALWNQFGENGFECTVLKVLKYEDPHEDHTAELEELRESCLLANPKAEKIWK